MSPLKILVVDDYEPIRRHLRDALQRTAGVQVIGEASDGLEAVRKAETLQPDLVLLDIGLPTIDGLEAGRRIRVVAPRARLLFVSIESAHQVIAETFRLGAGAFIHKSRALADLPLAIEAVLRGEIFVSDTLAFRHPIEASRHHEVVFFAHDSTLVESFARLVARSLKADQAAIVLATEPHRDGIAEWLRREDVDVDAAIQRGTYISQDAAGTLSRIMVNGVPDRALFFEGLRRLLDAATRAATTQDPRVTICGECVGLLCADGHLDAAIHLERAGNDLLKTHNVQILCGYPLAQGHTDDRVFERICAEHTAVHYR
jgi:DNA-binding NarL/FixJ family response regulator